MTEIMFVNEKDFSLTAKEVVRELDGRPVLLLRLSVVGPYFPRRDSEPFLRLGTEKDGFRSLMGNISSDQKEMRGYFPVDIPLKGMLEFGYDPHVIGSVPIVRLKAERLDARKLEVDAQRITVGDLGPFSRQG